MKIHIEPLPEGMWADGRRVVAFEEMYRRCYPQLVELCRRTLCGRGDAEAVAQEAFVRAWSSLDRFSGARPFWPWVATIARRLCIDHRRRMERESLNLHVEAAVCEQPTFAPDELLEADEECRSAVVALKSLKPSERRVITLRDINGWSYDEIARFEGVTIESIRGSLKRARASLRRSYAKVAAGAPIVWPFRLRGWGRHRIGRAVTGVARAGASVIHPGWAEASVGALAAVLALTTAAPHAGASTDTGALAAQVLPMAHLAVSTGPSAAAAGAGADRPRSQDVGPTATGDGVSAPVGPLGLLPPDDVRSPDDAVFHDLTASPSYETDGTLFAAGSAKQGCAYGTCPVLFRSTDGGASWVRLGARDYAGGRVLLPASFPVDPRIFVSGPAALQVSTDGGASFQAVAPIGGSAAISPTFATDGRIVIGQAPGWEYRDSARGMVPSGLVMPATSLSTYPMFSPDFANDGLLFVGATVASTDGAHRSTVFRCAASLCDATAPLSGIQGSPEIAVSGLIDGRRHVLAWRGAFLFRSDDAGRTFSSVNLPVAGAVQDAAFDASGRIVVGVRGHADGKAFGGIGVSSDGGRTWNEARAPVLRDGVDAVAALPDGRIVAAAGSGGIVCSEDGGASWSPRCAR